MIITVINNERISSIFLPSKASGQYWLYADAYNTDRLISIEAVNNDWVAKSNRIVKILDQSGQAVKSAVLSPLNVYTLQKEDGKRSSFFTEPATIDRQIYTKFITPSNISITVGRNEKSDICYNNLSVSGSHATLLCVNGAWHIKDEKSTNGTFANAQRVIDSDLYYGDVIYIMGLRIIVGLGFIAINNPDGKVTVDEKLKRVVSQSIKQADAEYEYELPAEEMFFRSPRFKRNIETAVFRIDPPPANQIGEEMPWPLVIGSSLAMGAMSMVTLGTAVASGNTTSMVMGGTMMASTLLIPTITKRYERNRKHKKEALRQTKYKEYLQSVSNQIAESCSLQESIMRENVASVEACEKSIMQTTRNLWERTSDHDDFLRVRLGVGALPLDAEFQYQEKRFSLENDNLQDELGYLCAEPKMLHNVPISYSLHADYISGIIGNRAKEISFVKGMIIQLAALYSYDEVKFIFLHNLEETQEFEFVKWLPHVWSNDKRFRFIATDHNESKEISSYLKDIIAYRKERSDSDLAEETPYFVIFSLSRDIAAHSEMLKQILSAKKNLNMSIVSVHDELGYLPKECSSVIELTDGKAKLFDTDNTDEQSTEFSPDISVNIDPIELSIKLSNIRLGSFDSSYKLPKTITFLQMFDVGMVEHLNVLTRWTENDPTKTLEAAVGIDAYGGLFKLDLHEKFHGPHGLIAGMTGSGKSEFIMTYILSLALNYHPDEVAFVLIDYKGGGMAKSFENLPHVAGIITNLDGSAIKRSLISIESELKRRQAIFAEASKNVGTSNIDIYKYQKLHRDGVVTEPLPHLFIISDEFAELKTQQPEFMTQLISTARIGRSLGVHLILATQKPSGVVDDQIWSNSRFRVCLKVQDRSDSMDMLKRPDAAELVDTGRFYLQVGYNELFELGQSAWAGAPYYPSESVQKEKDNSVVVVDRNGHVLREVRIDRNREKNPNAGKQLDAITEYIRKTAEDEGISVRPLWLEPLSGDILLSDVKNKYGCAEEKFKLCPVIGEYDDPSNQRQCAFRLPISDEGNAVIYGAAGSGKTSFLNAILYSLIEDHTPNELNLYILDFAAETLRAFAKAPHVGDVMLSYEDEKINNLFKMLLSEVESRKKRFADYGGDYASFIKSSGETLPSIVTVISNFTAFTETYEEKEEAVSYLSREGTKYGIYFVLTSLGTNGVRFRLLQNFKQLFTLQLNDESEYSSIVGKTEGLIPARIKGRGLFRHDNLYEFQVANLTADEELFAFIRERCAEFGASWNGTTARKVPILPKTVNAEFLSDYINKDKWLTVPIGVETESLNVHHYPFAVDYINFVLSSGDEYKQFLGEMACMLARNYDKDILYFDVQKTASNDMCGIDPINSPKDCEAEVSKLFDIVLYRNNTYKDAVAEGSECESFSDMLVFIDSIESLKNLLSSEANEKLSLILEKGSVDYRINLIIGEKAKALSAVSYEKWYKNHISGTDGIWIGSGITEQYQLKPTKTTGGMREEITPEYGYSLRKGKAVRIKLLNEETEDENYDQ